MNVNDIDFSQPPNVYKVGDRVHLKGTPVAKETTGTVIALDYEADNVPSLTELNLGVRVMWDNGDPPESWNNIALEYIQNVLN